MIVNDVLSFVCILHVLKPAYNTTYKSKFLTRLLAVVRVSVLPFSALSTPDGQSKNIFFNFFDFFV